MPENCCVCRNLYGLAGISFHRLPLDVDIRDKWKRAIGKHVGNSALVCSEHFAAEDFHKGFKKGTTIVRKLKRGVIPSLFLSNPAISYKETEWSHDNTPIAENDPASHVITSEPQGSDYKNPFERSHNSSNNTDETPAKIQHDNHGNKNSRSANHRKIKFVFNSSVNKQVHRVRYIGDLTPNDFTCPENYEVVKKYHKMSKHKIESQRKTICHLKAKVKAAKDLLSTLRSKGLITSNGSSLME